jgi:hypothetical protein
VTAPVAPDDEGAHDATAEADDGAPPRRLAVVVAWLVLTALAFALDGVTGAAVGVLVAAIVLARLSPKVLGGLGVVALVAAPISILLKGVPDPSDVSPFFVAGDLWPHHLVFAGLALVGCCAVLELGDHLRAAAHHEPVDGSGPHGDAPDPIEPAGRLPFVWRWAAAIAVAVAGLVVAVAVWFP